MSFALTDAIFPPQQLWEVLPHRISPHVYPEVRRRAQEEGVVSGFATYNVNIGISPTLVGIEWDINGYNIMDYDGIHWTLQKLKSVRTLV